MLNVFPELLFLGIFAPFFLRVAVGSIFFFIGYDHIAKKESFSEGLQEKFGTFSVYVLLFVGGYEIIIGLLLVAGLFTQAAALLGLIWSVEMLAARKLIPVLATERVSFYVLILVVCFSLMLTGAGAPAIDLPL